MAKNYRKKAQPNTCPLSDPNLGIIPENDHRVGLCLCRFCTCNTHICKANKPPGPYLSSTFSTKYKREYRSKDFDVSLRGEPQRYTPNTQKMDFVTSNSQFYSPIKPEKRKMTPTIPRRTQRELLERTSYANDYPNWGPYMVVREKTWHPPVRLTDIPFSGSCLLYTSDAADE